MAELIWDGKYDEAGRKVAPLKVALPFQTIETVNESAADRARTRSLFNYGVAGQECPTYNRLIWGDKKYVLPSLLPELAGQVNLIYIDPPFDTGADFSFTATVPDDPETPGDGSTSFTKAPSVIEQKAYRDIWGGASTHLDAYLKWFYETVVLLHELLHENESIYVHLDWRMSSYAKIVLDEVFGTDGFRNEIYWYYYNKMHDSRKGIFPRASDTILFYSKNHDNNHTFNLQHEERDKPVKQLVRKKVGGKMINARDDEGNVLYIEATHRTVDNIWRIPMLQPADQTQNLRYPTQKPEAFLERIIKASSNEGDIVLDCFCGSGTTAAVAEKLKRRWITCDLGRFAIHTARKRLLGIPEVRPFVVQNLGKYERQQWQNVEFNNCGPDTPVGQMQDESRAGVLGPQIKQQELAQRQRAYIEFILEMYRARPLNGYLWLHGVKGGRMVHVGSVDAPVTTGDLTNIAIEFRRAMGSGQDAPNQNGVDVLGWDFAFETNETAKQQAALAGIQMNFKRIPREILEKRAVEQGDIKFFELAALDVDASTQDKTLTLRLSDFVISPDDVPAEIQGAITHWSQWIDYWAVDFDHEGDTFHNQWQSYRTRKDGKLDLETKWTYETKGEYSVVVKVIDILGNDTTKTLKVAV